MIHFDHPANQIDQVDSEIKDMGKFYMIKEKVILSYLTPISYRSGSRQVFIIVGEVSLYFLGVTQYHALGLSLSTPV